MDRLDDNRARASRRSLGDVTISDVTISDVTISESSDLAGSGSSLATEKRLWRGRSASTSFFSSICDTPVINEQQMRQKLRVLQMILRHRYLQARGGEFAIPKSLWKDFRLTG